MMPRRPLPVRASGGNTPSDQGLERSASPVPSGPPVERGRPHSPSRHPAIPPSPSRPADDRAAAAWRALHDVLDPEFPISIVDLGLVYDLRATPGLLEIDLTFTATGCPCMDFIRDDIRERLAREPGLGEVHIREVWDPPWTPARISPAGRAQLRRHGVSA